MTKNTSAFLPIDLYEKIISILICLPFAFYLQIEHSMSFESLGVIYLAAGYGHFSLAHLYQAKAKKITLKLIALYVGVTLFLYYLAFNFTNPFLISVIFCTFLHVFNDEIFLSRQKTTLTRYSLAVTLTVVLMIFFVDFFYNSLDLRNIVICGITFFTGLYAFHIYKSGIKPFEIVIGLYALTFFSLTLFTDIHPVKIFIFTVVMHYMNWYVRMFKKTREIDTKRHRTYIIDVIWVHALIAAMIFIAAHLSAGNPLQTYFFDFKAGFVWVMLHNIFTMRLADYKGMGQSLLLPFRPQTR